MPNLRKVAVPTAQEHKTKLDLSFDHITTQRFMRLQPVGYRHMVAGERLSVTPHSVVRPAPIEVPFFGSVVQHIRLFYVPYRLAFPQYDSFIGDTIGVNQNGSSLVSSPPLIPYLNLFNLFTNPDFGMSTVETIVPGNDYDFTYGSNGVTLNYVGRHCLQLFESLGYRVIVGENKNGSYNALALLSMVRVYLDWYANHNYLNTQQVLEAKKLLAYNDPTVPLILSSQDLCDIYYLLRVVQYDNEDYITAAWDNPVSPISGQFTPLSFVDPSSTGGAYVVQNNNGTPEMVTNTTYPQSVGTTYIHEALKKLTDYQKRHSLTGALEIDRLLGEHGFVSPFQKIMRSTYVGSMDVVVETGSVMATSAGENTDGDTSAVGDYSGAGFGKSNDGKTFDFTASEDGFFVICSSIIPQGSLVQGYDRNNRLLTKEQFFNADFDALGLQAIEKGEVYVSDNAGFGNAADYANVFGFTGQYGEKKRPKSFVTGDFRLLNHFSGGSSWYLSRLFTDSSFNGSAANLVHSLAFTKGDDAGQYRRIFQYEGQEFDPFYCFFHFDMVAYSPMKPLFDTYEFDSNGKEITFDNNAKAN